MSYRHPGSWTTFTTSIEFNKVEFCNRKPQKTSSFGGVTSSHSFFFDFSIFDFFSFFVIFRHCLQLLFSKGQVDSFDSNRQKAELIHDPSSVFKIKSNQTKPKKAELIHDPSSMFETQFN
jgi:hypothetical protein